MSLSTSIRENVAVHERSTILSLGLVSVTVSPHQAGRVNRKVIPNAVSSKPQITSTPTIRKAAAG